MGRAGDNGQTVSAAGSNPYATGGGGVVLEHVYGATVLAAMLLSDPVVGLGDEQAVVRVAFQAGAWSPVDDVMVEGESRGSASGGRRLSVGVRRDPTIASSDEKFVKLLADCLRVVVEHPGEVASDAWRLALAVAAPHTGAAETAVLADLARHRTSGSLFRQAVAAPRATTNKVRRRLKLLDEAVAAAAPLAGLDPAGLDLA